LKTAATTSTAAAAAAAAAAATATTGWKLVYLKLWLQSLQHCMCHVTEY
jgi:hypothetical protein